MILHRVFLQSFRNFDTANFTFNPVLTIIIGENARGKTNLLESVFVTVNGHGFRESKEEELIQWKKDSALVESVWNENGAEILNQIMLDNRNGKVEKKYYVNKSKKSHFAYEQYQIRTVLFAPEHIDIVTSSPDIRRDYFNKLIFSFDPEYKKKLHNYEHALYRRNKILEHHANSLTLDEELAFWNDYLESNGSYITKKREEYMNYLNENKDIEGKRFRIEYLKNEFTKSRLLGTRSEELRLRRTMIGPHKDDFHIFLTTDEEKNIHHFGSRSEQRLGVFWLKLNEIRFLETFFKKKPLLLLDDVFSELDTKNKKLILDLIGSYQTVLTTTEQELVDLAHIEKQIVKL